MADGNTPVHVAAAAFSARYNQGAFWFRLRNFFKGVPGHPTKTGGDGFILFNSHYLTPSNTSMVSPGARVTSFLVSRGEQVRRLRHRRVRFAGTLITFTRITFTSNKHFNCVLDHALGGFSIHFEHILVQSSLF
jgi:hypothetical protein